MLFSIPTAPTSFLIHFTRLAKTARQQKAALTAGQRRRASKTSRHGWQADSIIRWKWRDCNACVLPCCSGLSVPKSFRNLFTISNRKSPNPLVVCLGSEPEGNGFCTASISFPRLPPTQDEAHCHPSNTCKRFLCPPNSSTWWLAGRAQRRRCNRRLAQELAGYRLDVKSASSYGRLPLGQCLDHLTKARLSCIEP